MLHINSSYNLRCFGPIWTFYILYVQVVCSDCLDGGVGKSGTLPNPTGLRACQGQFGFTMSIIILHLYVK